MIKTGTVYKISEKVTDDKTALYMKSGDVKVFATPCLVALMENCANTCLKQFLEPGQISVGTMIKTTHISATVTGMEVWAECEITGADGRCVSFSLKAYDEKGLIGEGEHTRVILDEKRFMDKANSKITK